MRSPHLRRVPRRSPSIFGAESKMDGNSIHRRQTLHILHSRRPPFLTRRHRWGYLPICWKESTPNQSLKSAPNPRWMRWWGDPPICPLLHTYPSSIEGALLLTTKKSLPHADNSIYISPKGEHDQGHAHQLHPPRVCKFNFQIYDFRC